MAKPAIDATWATSGTALIADPGVGKRDTGWIVEIPPVEFFNWWMNNVGSWVSYLDGQVDLLIAEGGITFDAYVGAGCPFADINAVMADPDIANIHTVLVCTPIAVDDVQIIDNDGMTFTFKGDAGLTKNGITGSSNGLQISADRIKIVGGRFIDFDGDAVSIDATKKNSLITQCSFLNCANLIDDNGDNNTFSANIEEV